MADFYISGAGRCQALQVRMSVLLLLNEAWQMAIALPTETTVTFWALLQARIPLFTSSLIHQLLNVCYCRRGTDVLRIKEFDGL